MFNIANTISVISSLLAFLVLGFGLLRSVTGETAIGDFVAAGALAVVPYCFAGAWHRSIGPEPDRAPDS
jgi:hypothetical protein